MQKKYIIIGGGPAGTSVGISLLNRGEKNVTIIEKDKFPRVHIGESLQADMHDIFKALGIDVDILEKKFLRKYGVIYKWAKNTKKNTILRGKDNERWVVPFSQKLTDLYDKNDESLLNSDFSKYKYGFNVDRYIFDKILLNHFIKKGGNVINDKIINIESDGNTILSIKGLQNAYYADIFIDASGQFSLFSKHFGLKVFDSTIKNISIYGYFKNYTGMDKILGKNIQYIEHIGDCWFWWIPVSEEIVSVGMIFESNRKYGKEDFFKFLKNTSIFESISNSKLVDPIGKETDNLNFISDYSYVSKKIYGKNWYLIGDAYGFVDPILSGGVSFSMEKGILLGKILSTINKKPENKKVLDIFYSVGYKKDVEDYLYMSHLWYDNINTKQEWIKKTGSKKDFVDYISGGRRFLKDDVLFKKWKFENIK